MALLSELAKIKIDMVNILASLSLEPAIEEKLTQLDFFKKNNDIPNINNSLTNISEQYQELINIDQKIINDINELIKQIDTEFESIGRQYKIYEDISNDCGVTYEDEFWTIPDLNPLVRAMIEKYSDWRYPGLQLYPTANKIINYMVASDPLYLVGNLKILNRQKQEYPSQYQRRLRLYSGDRLCDLPAEQFGLVFTADFFTQLNFNKLVKYLEIIYSLLRPGGTIVFNYNNCDLVETAMLCETGKVSFASKRMINEVATNLGYKESIFTDIELENMHPKYSSWAELHKPGKLSTIKRHQTVGKILIK